MSTNPGSTGATLTNTVDAAKADLGGQARSAAAALGDAAAKIGDLKRDASDVAGIASSIAGDAATHGRALLSAARGQATSFADERKNDAAQSVADVASTLRDTAGTFEGRPNIQAFVGSAADGLEDLATTIRERSFAELYDEAQLFARRQPATVALGALAAGFLLARFIKSTSEELADKAEAASPRRRKARAPSEA